VIGLTLAAFAAATAIVALGAAIQGSVGFGLALVAVPVLVLIDPGFIPGPFLCVAIAFSVLVAVREHRSIDFGQLKWALGGRIPGNFMFGVLVLAAVAISASPRRIEPTAAKLVGAGLLSGVMGTTAAVGGPPIALLLQHSPGPKLRATLSGFFFVGAIVSLLALVSVGRFAKAELLMASTLMPGMLLGFLVSGPARQLFDRGYTRPAVLALATVGALVVLLREILAG
jgi:uncharacterized membrane protein YfcA